VNILQYFAILFALLTLYFALRALSKYRQLRAVRQAPDGKRSVVSGKIKPIRTLTSPIFGESCVYYSSTVRSAGGRRTQVLPQRCGHEEFYIGEVKLSAEHAAVVTVRSTIGYNPYLDIEDEGITAGMMFDPASLQRVVRKATQQQTHPDRKEQICKFLKGINVDSEVYSTGNYRFIETTLKPGQEANAIIEKGNGGRTLLIADCARPELERTLLDEVRFRARVLAGTAGVTTFVLVLGSLI
jgi:hypothetical protein